MSDVRDSLSIPNMGPQDRRELLPDGLVWLAYRGSIAHAMYVPQSSPDSIDDKDLMGVFIAPQEHYLGFGRRDKDGARAEKGQVELEAVVRDDDVRVLQAREDVAEQFAVVGSVAALPCVVLVGPENLPLVRSVELHYCTQDDAKARIEACRLDVEHGHPYGAHEGAALDSHPTVTAFLVQARVVTRITDRAARRPRRELHRLRFKSSRWLAALRVAVSASNLFRSCPSELLPASACRHHCTPLIRW